MCFSSTGLFSNYPSPSVVNAFLNILSEGLLFLLCLYYFLCSQFRHFHFFHLLFSNFGKEIIPLSYDSQVVRESTLAGTSPIPVFVGY